MMSIMPWISSAKVTIPSRNGYTAIPEKYVKGTYLFSVSTAQITTLISDAPTWIPLMVAVP